MPNQNNLSPARKSKKPFILFLALLIVIIFEVALISFAWIADGGSGLSIFIFGLPILAISFVALLLACYGVNIYRENVEKDSTLTALNLLSWLMIAIWALAFVAILFS